MEMKAAAARYCQPPPSELTRLDTTIVSGALSGFWAPM